MIFLNNRMLYILILFDESVMIDPHNDYVHHDENVKMQQSWEDLEERQKKYLREFSQFKCKQTIRI